MALDDDIARLRREMADTLAALPDPGLEGAPTRRAQKAEARRVLSEQQAEINGIHSGVTKSSALVKEWRGERARTVEALALSEDRGVSAPSEAERYAWREAVRYLEGKSSYEVPGPIVMMRRESGRRLATLPTCEEQLSRAEADLAAHLERLRAAIAAWDRSQVATGTIDATLPSPEMHITATVK